MTRPFLCGRQALFNVSGCVIDEDKIAIFYRGSRTKYGSTDVQRPCFKPRIHIDLYLFLDLGMNII